MPGQRLELRSGANRRARDGAENRKSRLGRGRVEDGNIELGSIKAALAILDDLYLHASRDAQRMPFSTTKGEHGILE